MAQPFDPDRLRLDGEVFPVAEQIGISGNVGQGAFSASGNGVLAYRTGGPVANREFDWTDRAGKRLDTLTTPGLEIGGALSWDEKRLAFSMANQSGDLSNLWLQDLERKVVSRFTFEPGTSFVPIWSPDGAHIAFAYTNGGAQYSIFQKALTGTGKAELLSNVAVNASTWDWSPDGKFILYSDYHEKTKYDLWMLPLEGDHKAIPYLQTSFSETHGQYSPNGRWVAYASDESGRFEVYVQSIPASGPKWQISTGGGDFPRWGRDGKELYYIAADQKLMEMPVKMGSDPSGGFEPGAPQPLFRIEPLNASPTAAIPYQPGANGQRFLVNVQAGGEGAQAPPITVVLNWTAGLKK
jgi:Tol biopolymer transport system component